MKSSTLVGYKVAADAAAKAVMFAITVIAAHRLTRDAFGAFALASTLGWMLAVVTDGGMQMHVARELARQPWRAAWTIRRWLRLRVGLTCGAAAIVVAAAALGAFGHHAFAHVVIVQAYLLAGLVEFFHYVYRGLARTDLESSLVLTQRLLTLGTAGAVLLWTPSLDLFALALLLPVIVTLALTRGISTQLTREEDAGAAPSAADPDAVLASAVPVGRRGPADAALSREFVRDVLPIGAGVALSAIYFRLDVFLIQLWNGSEAVALYSAVFRLVDALRLFPAAVLAVALPRLCRARDMRPLRHVAMRITAFAIVVGTLLAAAAPWVAAFVYGPSYAEAGPAFRVLLLSFPLLSLNYALTHQLVAWNAHRAYAVICAVALAANVAMNRVLVPAQGIVGAAWATLGTEVVLTAGCALALARVRERGEAAMAVAAAPAPLARGETRATNPGETVAQQP